MEAQKGLFLYVEKARKFNAYEVNSDGAGVA
jgi:hypothetical protein